MSLFQKKFTTNTTNKKPARRLAYGSGAFKWYVAVAAYYVDLLGCPDDCSALGANVLDAAILAGATPAALYRERGFVAVLVIIVALALIWKAVLRLAVKSSMPGCWASHSAVSSVRVVTVHP